MYTDIYTKKSLKFKYSRGFLEIMMDIYIFIYQLQENFRWNFSKMHTHYPKRRKIPKIIPKSDFVLVENFTDVNAPWILKGAEEK